MISVILGRCAQGRAHTLSTADVPGKVGVLVDCLSKTTKMASIRPAVAFPCQASISPRRDFTEMAPVQPRCKPSSKLKGKQCAPSIKEHDPREWVPWRRWVATWYLYYPFPTPSSPFNPLSGTLSPRHEPPIFFARLEEVFYRGGVVPVYTKVNQAVKAARRGKPPSE